jgi:tetratricopeptide (TPR) repeat protein
LEKGDSDRAIADFTQAIQLSPKYTQAYNNRGVAYFERGDIDRAIADYTQAIELDPKFALAYNNRSNAYGVKGDIDRAIADFAQAAKLNPFLKPSPTPSASRRTADAPGFLTLIHCLELPER